MEFPLGTMSMTPSCVKSGNKKENNIKNFLAIRIPAVLLHILGTCTLSDSLAL